MSRSLKTTRNLSQIAEKKLVGKAHSSANKTDNAEDIPSAVQLNTTTIFGQPVPSSPSTTITSTLYGVTGNVQKVQFDVEEIGLTRYDADASTEAGGDDSPQSNGPHGWALKLTSDYETQSGSNHSKVGTAPIENGTKVFETLGALQLVPTNMYINSSDPANNPYIPKIYTWDGSNNSSKSTTPLTISDHLDWFVDAYAGTVFFQEYDGRVPYKVEAYIYIGDMADVTGGAGAINDLSDVNVPSPTNNQVLTYNSSTSKWEAQNASGGGGIERYSYTQSGSSTSAGTDITIPSMDFTGVTPTNADTTVYLNGSLLLGGTVTQVGTSDVDYAFNNNTQMRFAFDIVPDDQVVIFHTTTSFSTGKDILLHTDDASFNNARVITAGDGISISTATPRQLIINNTGLLQRSKTHVTSSTTYSTNNAFTVTGVDFSTKSYSDNRIDIFLEGVLLIKGVDYQLKDQDSTLGTNQFKLIGTTSIGNGDIITAILF